MTNMSLEKSVKGQFAIVFSDSDWKFFKEMAGHSFSEAAFLKKSDFKRVPVNRRLLVRNSRKRLLIAIGAELLLKAIYLKGGYCINKLHQPPKNCGLKIPFKPADALAAGLTLDATETFTLSQLIDSLNKVDGLKTVPTDGLKIARVFRNKEGHVVTMAHAFDPASFRAIEKALISLYQNAFHECLSVRFSVAPNENAEWETTPQPCA
jgi:hypothetical protein